MASVEASIHDRLDATARWLDERGYGQGGAGHRPGRWVSSHPTEQLPKDQHHPGIDGPKQHGEHRIRHGPTDDSVNVVQAITQDRHGDSNRKHNPQGCGSEKDGCEPHVRQVQVETGDHEAQPEDGHEQ
jgi:hypothetical protein